MPLTETELDQMFGALADSNRRKVILSLRSGAKTVEALREPLGISTMGTLKHIRVLEECGLVVSEKKGRSRYCQLRPDRLETVTSWIDEVQNFWAGNLERLAEQLREPK